jgi:hypothetical protein
MPPQIKWEVASPDFDIPDEHKDNKEKRFGCVGGMHRVIGYLGDMNN